MICAACQKRGKTWEGDDPRCAFVDGVFAANNWNCATVDLIRDIFDDTASHGGVDPRVDIHFCVPEGDQKYATIDLSEFELAHEVRCLWVSWYKDRGRTEAMWLLSEEEVPRLPTEDDCTAIATAFAANSQVIGNRDSKHAGRAT